MARIDLDASLSALGIMSPIQQRKYWSAVTDKRLLQLAQPEQLVHTGTRQPVTAYDQMLAQHGRLTKCMVGTQRLTSA